jgi:hypothetical protein
MEYEELNEDLKKELYKRCANIINSYWNLKGIEADTLSSCFYEEYEEDLKYLCKPYNLNYNELDDDEIVTLLVLEYGSEQFNVYHQFSPTGKDYGFLILNKNVDLEDWCKYMNEEFAISDSDYNSYLNSTYNIVNAKEIFN